MKPRAKQSQAFIEIVTSGDDAVAVIAEHMWSAKQGLEALAISWDAGANGKVTMDAIVDKMDEGVQVPGRRHPQ